MARLATPVVLPVLGRLESSSLRSENFKKSVRFSHFLFPQEHCFTHRSIIHEGKLIDTSLRKVFKRCFNKSKVNHMRSVNSRCFLHVLFGAVLVLCCRSECAKAKDYTISSGMCTLGASSTLNALWVFELEGMPKLLNDQDISIFEEAVAREYSCSSSGGPRR